jgi:glyoxylase-like metal-dependent hydrolase (beta-lactamase superfamily II)
MKRCFLLALFFALPASCLAADDSFEIKPVADGVYAAIAKPTYRVNSNTVIILLGDCVLVVDANSTPSAARSLIEQIKKLTPKPVKYVVNTHFHWDHSQGNEAYLSAWPAGVEIISSEATRSNIEQLGIPRWKYEVVSMPREIEQLKSDLQKASSAEHKKAIQKKLVEAEAYFAELKDIQITFPTMTVDRRLILHRDSRTVEILWLGRAHTDGDLFVFLPAEKVLATGDALHGWTPTMRDSYPYEWIQTLDAAEKLDFEYVIGGHGEVMHGKQKFELWKQYFRDLLESTTAAYVEGATMEEAKKRVSEFLTTKYADKFDHFPQNVAGDVAKAYQVINPSR